MTCLAVTHLTVRVQLLFPDQYNGGRRRGAKCAYKHRDMFFIVWLCSSRWIPNYFEVKVLTFSFKGVSGCFTSVFEVVGVAGGLAWRCRFAPPGECVRRGATVSVCDSSFVDLKLTVLKPMVSTLSQVVNVFFTSTCRCSETKRCSPDLQDRSSQA